MIPTSWISSILCNAAMPIFKFLQNAYFSDLKEYIKTKQKTKNKKQKKKHRRHGDNKACVIISWILGILSATSFKSFASVAFKVVFFTFVCVCVSKNK